MPKMHTYHFIFLYFFSFFLFHTVSAIFWGFFRVLFKKTFYFVLKYSCLENPTDGGAWWAIVRGVTKGRT